MQFIQIPLVSSLSTYVHVSSNQKFGTNGNLYWGGSNLALDADCTEHFLVSYSLSKQMPERVFITGQTACSHTISNLIFTTNSAIQIYLLQSEFIVIHFPGNRLIIHYLICQTANQ